MDVFSTILDAQSGVLGVFEEQLWAYEADHIAKNDENNVKKPRQANDPRKI